MRKFIFKKHTSLALSIISALGVVGSVVLSSKSAVDSVKILYDKNLSDTDKKKKIIKTYVPTAAVTIGTVVCIISSGILNHKLQTSLIGAYALADQSFRQYKNKIIARQGLDFHKEIEHELMCEKADEDLLITANCRLFNVNNDFVDKDNPETTHIFYDPISERYFESTLSKVLQAEYHLNRNYLMSGAISLNEFYKFLGIDTTDYGETVGWSNWDDHNIYWIDFAHIPTEINNKTVCVVEPVFGPSTGYLEE